MRIELQEFRAQVEPVHRKLQAWRRNRKHHRERIPESLWTAMAKLARGYGVSRVCHALGVEYPALKRRVHGTQGTPADQPTAAFVELAMPSRTDQSGCVVELEDGSGAKITVRLTQSGSAEVVGLVQAFWRRGG
jgi:hypothetical protein